MSDEPKQTIQDTFNVFAGINSIADVQKGLDLLSKHSAEERKELADKIDEALIQEFFDDMPSPTELEMVLGLSAMLGEAPDEEDLEIFQGILMIADAVVTEQGENASPVTTKVLETVGQLSDEDFNTPATLLKSIVQGHAEGKQAARGSTENPFRKKYGGPNGQ